MSPLPSPEPRRQTHHLAVESGEAVMRTRLARIAFVRAAVEPDYACAAARPGDEGGDARRLGETAAVLTMMDHQSRRQPRRRAENIGDILAAA